MYRPPAIARRNRPSVDADAALADPARVAAVAALQPAGELAGPELDELARQAAIQLRSPMAAIVLVDADDLHVLGRFGSTAGPTDGSRLASPADPPELTYCRYVVADARAIEIADAQRYPILRRGRAQDDAGPRAYLGVPILTPESNAVGTVCVADRFARRWNADDHARLARIAQLALRCLDRGRVGLAN